ncbi:FadR/GntR family transcriptional regulator [Arthrobacter sp. MMS18-M83]|uniref:FadR/GntR family transcriptional regulator n=1 Tax=Arthrobacter sp. MMS18-M83 TaxID=2996261 RepID=UPI00227B741C|nr:FadR/GntR family transcriptional regulator [Arthrobacter sp. MMS18-M83]WAH99169.1 FadR/GntR family transcriptional regulator [Arthrobacter sp. MMS18-M83]
MPPNPEDLSSWLEARIMREEFKPGEKLPSERALAEELGVGRPLVREILRGLQERGLVTSHAGRGTFVREIATTESGVSVEVMAKRGLITPRELIVARSMLETQTAHLAAAHREEPDLERMRQHLGTLEQRQSPTVALQADLAFHEAIALASGNRVLQIMFGSIRNLIQGIMIRSLSDAAVRAEALPSHQLIYEAILAGDGDLAREHMRGHLAVAEKLYGDDLDKAIRDVVVNRGIDSPDLFDW